MACQVCLVCQVCQGAEAAEGTRLELTSVDGLAQIMTALADPHFPWEQDAIDSVVKQTAKDLHLKKKSELMLALRHALTGEKSGPMIAELMFTLGREEAVRRLREGRSWVVRRLRE